MKRNLMAKELSSSKYSQRIVKPKRGKGSYKRKKVKKNDMGGNC
jgi:stalled ribosome alternative rescue factor ArfA